MKKFLVLGLALFATPMVASAADLVSIINLFGNIIATLVPIVISLAVLVFLWGLVSWLWKSGEEKEGGLKIMTWGIITLFVMVSIWGLVNLLSDTLGLEGNIVVENPVNVIGR